MQVWQDTFRELKNQYMLNSVERLDQIEELLNRVAKTPSDLGMLRDLMRQYHWLAGSGGIYGFPQITKLGTTGEQLCEEILRKNRPLTKPEWDKCRALLDALRAAFEVGEDPQRQTIQKELPTMPKEATDVVIVETDQSNFLMLTRLMEEQGMLIRSARMLSSGLSKVKEQMPKVIILGLPLPDGSGYEFVEEVRRLPGGEVPVIFIIGKHTGFLDKVQAVHCGVDGFYESPVDWDAMMQRMKYLLDRNKPSLYKILSVEDDPDQGEFIKAVLESAGYECTVVADPRVFEEGLLEVQPDLVLLDIMLPGISGFELAKYLRQNERYATLPILFLSTQNQLEAHVESAKVGGDDHLVKPIAPSLLLSAVAGRLERARFLKHLLHRDGMTRLLTHGAFMEAAQATIAQCKRNLDKLAGMIIFDIDNFAEINKKYGYSAGDRVLVTLASLLKQRIRQSDKVARYGGEEIVTIVEDLEEFDAVNLANRLLQDFHAIEHKGADGTMFRATFSAGVAMLDAKVMDVERWQRLTEQAVTAAKAAGRNCVMKAQIGRR